AENGWRDDGDGTMNAIEFGSACWFGGCTGPGPWVEADLEQGMYSSITGPNNASNPGITYPFVTAWEKNNGTSNFTLKYGNANSGSLTTTYSGALPAGGYSPMRLENSVLLGTGGGNDHGDTGEFFEGAVTAGFPSDATENAVQSELTSVGYAAGAVTTQGFPSGYHRLVVGNDNLCLDSYGNTSNAGAAIDQYTCNGQTNQQLQFVPTSGGYGELQVENSGQDVTVANSSTSQGVTDIVQEPVNGNAASQWLPAQQSDGSWQFKNKNSGLCLDVYGAGSNNGQQLDQWPCKNAPGTNQDFTPR
ncbi:MAG TPA: arabinofuranosidase catalytic domain-containing protein, partial [Actinocrinis sp.]|nr:arabinofuranosidase catalytic domain-containing protein [Actinocrinis sp.]